MYGHENLSGCKCTDTRISPAVNVQAQKKDRESSPGPLQSSESAVGSLTYLFSTMRTAPYIPASFPRTASLNWVLRQAWKATGR